MEIQCSETQRRASIAALSAPPFNDYARVACDVVEWLPPFLPFYDEQGNLKRPAWSELYSMAAAYVDYHFKGLYSVDVFSEYRDSLVQVVKDEWVNNVGPIRGVGYDGEWNSTAIDDLQCGFTAERLPCWAWEMGTPEPLLGAEPVPEEDAEKFGADYLPLLAEESISPFERLARLREWAEGIHAVECHDHTLGPKEYTPEYVGPLDISVSERNYHSMLRGEPVWFPALDE
jgi:hypothetical protein